MAITSALTEPARNTIVIELNHGEPGSTVNQTVHQHQLMRLQQQVDEAVTKVKHQRDTITKRRCIDPDPWFDALEPLDQGLVFFIDGTRGAGKSTFLRIACRRLCHELNGEQTTSAASSPSLGFLTLMDPSRVETKEVLLLSVIRLLQRKVEHHPYRMSEGQYQRDLKSFRKCLEKLAGGLSLLRGDYDPLKDADPEVFLISSLERVDHGDGLRSAFHELIEAACQTLRVDALVLAFDDADTNAEKGQELMECIRKYLNSPRLVILVAGDMELYTQLVRKHFVKSVGKDVDGADPARQSQHCRMLDHLENQYLLKIFPAHRRYRLAPLQYLLDQNTDICIGHTQWGNSKVQFRTYAKETFE